ncbi:MAG: ATP-dependent protease LonB [Bacillota bacterium]
MGEFGPGFSSVILLLQVFFGVVIGLYFWNLLKAQQGSKVAVERGSRSEIEKLRKLRSISLTEPLAEKTRPACFSEIVGQEEGLKALRAALCGPNPQHVIVYGPPGIGKTAAARLVLEEARRNAHSPFGEEARFIEIDATTARFDERGIADPLIGSVHDPIYQGAGPLGMAGVPQPKPGAVTRAHGGILFIDEIGELHPVQMNKLLKVLEDRKVILESSYYNPDDTQVPQHIHDIFQNGLPADFRLVGATTRMPENISPALRSRCLEIFFRPLVPEQVGRIAANAGSRIGFPLEAPVLKVITKYATNGREAVNIVQLAAGLVLAEARERISVADVEWVVHSGQYAPRPERSIPEKPAVGRVNGLAVYGPNAGMMLEIEATATPVKRGTGKLIITGLVDEEELNGGGRVIRRKSLAKSAVENVLTALKPVVQFNPEDYCLHINFPGGMPVDGPSAGVAVATAICSAVYRVPVSNEVAMTGEVSIRGLVKPVGGVVAKIEAAAKAGAKRVFIPAENFQELYRTYGETEVVPVAHLSEVLAGALIQPLEAAAGGGFTDRIGSIPAGL